MSQMNLDWGLVLLILLARVCFVTCWSAIVSFPPLLTVDLISVGSARASANIPLSLQTHRCSTNGTWNGQLKARNCLFHQLPLLRDQLGNNLISVAGKIQIEDTKGYISVCLSKCIWSTSFFSECPLRSLVLSLSDVNCVRGRMHDYGGPNSLMKSHFNTLSYIYMYIKKPTKQA